MPQYLVFGKVIGGKFLGKFKAKTKKEAIEKAEKETCISLCHYCSRQIEDPEITEIIAEIDE